MEARQNSIAKLSLFSQFMPIDLVISVCMHVQDPAAIRLIMFLYLLQTTKLRKKDKRYRENLTEINGKFNQVWQQLHFFHYPKTAQHAKQNGSTAPYLTQYKQSAVAGIPAWVLQYEMEKYEVRKLFSFITWNNLAGIKSLALSTECLLENKNAEGRDAIAYACFLERKEILYYFYQFGLKSCTENEWKSYSIIRHSSIHWAAACGLLDKVKEEYASNFNYLNTNGANLKKPIDVAAEYGHLDIVKFCIENDKTNLSRFESTPLCYAALNNHLHVAEYLIAQGAKINPLLNRTDETVPLFYAVEGGNLEMVQYLVSQGAILNVEVQVYGTLTHMAARYGKNDILFYLIENDNLVDKLSTDGETPLSTALRKRHLETMKILLEHGADVNKRINNRMTILDIAIWSGYLDGLKLLLENGFNFNNKKIEAFIADAEDIERFEISSFLYLWKKYKTHENKPLLEKIKMILFASKSTSKVQRVVDLFQSKLFYQTEKKLISELSHCLSETEFTKIVMKYEKKIDSIKYDFIMQYILNDKKLIAENTTQVSIQKK